MIMVHLFSNAERTRIIIIVIIIHEQTFIVAVENSADYVFLTICLCLVVILIHCRETFADHFDFTTSKT